MIDTRYMYDNQYTKEFLDFLQKNYFRRNGLTLLEISGGLVLPLKKSEPGGPLMGYGGVLDNQGNYVSLSAQIGKGDTLDRFNGKYEYDKAQERKYEETVIYIGAYPPHWGHFLVDMSYRFWYLLKEQAPYKIVYCSEKEEISGVYLEFFELLGIKTDRLFRIEKPSRFDRILIPEPAYMACDYYTEEYKSIFDRMIRKAEQYAYPVYEKIYLSRGHFGEAKGKEIGEQSIERNLKENGYHILYMEELGLKEQIFYISHCKKMAALSGTLCHNIVFAGKDTELIILNKTHIMNTHQVLLEKMKEINVTYIDVYKEPFRGFPLSYGAGPFLLDSRGMQSYMLEQGMRYYPESARVRFTNRLIYAKMCLCLWGYKQYERAYYKLCKHKLIIGLLRKVKGFFVQD